MKWGGIAALCLVLAGCAETYRDQSKPIASKADFDPSRYVGLWYEIARFPVRFQDGCVGVSAEYQPVDQDTVSVHNICRASDGSIRSQIRGTADVVGPGRLKVQFPSIPFVRSDYWVLWVDEDYQTAVVGTPNGTSGWILNRTPTLRADRLAAAKEILDFNGYDIKKLEMTAQ